MAESICRTNCVSCQVRTPVLLISVLTYLDELSKTSLDEVAYCTSSINKNENVLPIII